MDRYFVTVDWLDQFPDVTVQHLSFYGFDHNPLLLSTGSSHPHSHQFKFDPEWLKNEEFVNLVIKWWQEFTLSQYRMGLSWHKKTKYLKKKIQGWARNYYGAKK